MLLHLFIPPSIYPFHPSILPSLTTHPSHNPSSIFPSPPIPPTIPSFIFLSLYLSFHPSFNPRTHPSIHPSSHSSVHPSIPLYLSIPPCILPFIPPSIHPSFHHSVNSSSIMPSVHPNILFFNSFIIHRGSNTCLKFRLYDTMYMYVLYIWNHTCTVWILKWVFKSPFVLFLSKNLTTYACFSPLTFYSFLTS